MIIIIEKKYVHNEQEICIVAHDYRINHEYLAELEMPPWPLWQYINNRHGCQGKVVTKLGMV